MAFIHNKFTSLLALVTSLNPVQSCTTRIDLNLECILLKLATSELQSSLR